MQPFSRTLLALVAALATFGSSPAQAIFGGTTDTAHPAVGLVLDTTSQTLCSGVLLAPTVVLTAGHCLVGNPNAGDYIVSFATTPGSLADFVSVAELHVHPDFSASTTIVHDLGVLILTDPASETPLRWLDVDPGGVYQVGAMVDSVGYGATSLGVGDGTRRSAAIDIDQLDAATFQHDQTDGKGPCEGDDGGPALAPVSNRTTVIGTASYGDQACATNSVFMRTDAESAFITTFAPESGSLGLAATALGALVAVARRRA
jgi:secreted trypsin-like serine protease